MALKLKYLAPLLILVAGSAYVNAINTVGDWVEHVNAFISPVLTYIAIAALFGKYQGFNIFSRTFIKYFSILFIVMTVVDTAYPAFIYREQNFPPDFWVVFFVQLLLNIYIVRVITSE